MKKDRYGGTGAILADDMGLGKTLQSITLMYSLLKNKDASGKPLAKRCIVVCPCSLVKNWEDEFEKWINSKYDLGVPRRCLHFHTNRLRERMVSFLLKRPFGPSRA